MTSFETISPRRKIADEVEDQLLSMIKDAGLAPGDRLPSERSLQETYAVGRVAIREAMQNLQRRGLVDIRHGGRPRVANPKFETVIGDLNETMRHLLTHSPDSFEQCKQARSIFETGLVRVAAEHRTAADIALLRRIVERQDSAKAQIEGKRRQVDDDGHGLRTEYDDFIRLDREFHRSIAGISRNPIVETLCAALFEWLTNFRIDELRKPGLERLTIAEHTLIVDAIEAGEPKQSAELMAQHLNRAHNLYYQHNSRVPKSACE